MVLGGDGQGVPWDGNVATAYLGPGPWGSLAPALPSHPAQAYEAFSTVIVLLFVLTLLTLGRFGRRAGGAFLAGIALWAVGRAIVASTWRDPAVVGQLNMGQVLAIGVAAGMLVLLLSTSWCCGGVRSRRRRSRRRGCRARRGRPVARPGVATPVLTAAAGSPPLARAPPWRYSGGLTPTSMPPGGLR